MELQELPKRLIVLGGGPEGLEFGQAFQRFGSTVTMLERDSRLAPGKDPEISQAIEEILREEGVEILTGNVPTGVGRRGDHLAVETSGGNTLEGDALLVSTGRKPHDLGELGIGEPESRAIPSGASRSTRSCARTYLASSRSAT